MMAGSLRLRLLIAAAIAIAAALIFAGVALTALYEQQVRNRVMQELENDLLQLLGAIEISKTGEVVIVRDLADPRFDQPFSGKYWRIDQLGPRTSTSANLLRSRSLWDADPATISANLGPENEVLVSTERSIIIKHNNENINLHLIVSTHDEEITSPIAYFRNQLVLYLSLIGLALTAAAWLQVAIGLRPLQALRRQLALLGQSHANRLEGNFPTEVEPLVSEFNEVLDLRDKSLERARHRAGDLAHGLMTPLTILSAIARDVGKKHLDKQSSEIIEQVENMRLHVERGLVRARLATGRGHDKTPLAETVNAVFATLRRLPKGTELLLINNVPRDVTVPLERNDLLELLGNLLDNARKHAKSEVRIGYLANSIVIEDDGPGVPDDELQAIRKRGRRLDEKDRGFGLGLAIVEDIAELYELELSYGRSDLGGLQVTLLIGP